MQLTEAQRQDPALSPIHDMLASGKGDDADYVLADNGLPCHAPLGWMYAIAVPSQLVPGVLALVHGTCGHPGAAQGIVLIERKFHRPTLERDVRAHVLSCPCRRRKRAWSTQLAMMPARLLQP